MRRSPRFTVRAQRTLSAPYCSAAGRRLRARGIGTRQTAGPVREALRRQREEHIARHRVSVAEVEEVAFATPYVRKARQGYFRLIGQTEDGRYLTVFIAPRGGGVYSLVTARDATDSERRLYRAHRRS